MPQMVVHDVVSKAKHLLKQRQIRHYLVIGGSVYAVEVAIILGLQHFGVSDVIGVAVSYWLGLTLSFALQKVFTFQDRRLHHRILLPQIAAYIGLISFNFGFTILVSKLFAHLLPVVILRSIALGITMIWNFYLYRTKIFKDDDTIGPISG